MEIQFSEVTSVQIGRSRGSGHLSGEYRIITIVSEGKEIEINLFAPRGTTIAFTKEADPTTPTVQREELDRTNFIPLEDLLN